VLAGGLAQQLGPEPFGADHDQVVALRWRDVVVVHDDHTHIGNDDLRVERGGWFRVEVVVDLQTK
jgi:hypothetical protein